MRPAPNFKLQDFQRVEHVELWIAGFKPIGWQSCFDPWQKIFLYRLHELRDLPLVKEDIFKGLEVDIICDVTPASNDHNVLRNTGLIGRASGGTGVGEECDDQESGVDKFS